MLPKIRLSHKNYKERMPSRPHSHPLRRTPISEAVHNPRRPPEHPGVLLPRDSSAGPPRDERPADQHAHGVQ